MYSLFFNENLFQRYCKMSVLTKVEPWSLVRRSNMQIEATGNNNDRQQGGLEREISHPCFQDSLSPVRHLPPSRAVCRRLAGLLVRQGTGCKPA
jgi:hypothetical protein